MLRCGTLEYPNDLISLAGHGFGYSMIKYPLLDTLHIQADFQDLITSFAPPHCAFCMPRTMHSSVEQDLRIPLFLVSVDISVLLICDHSEVSGIKQPY